MCEQYPAGFLENSEVQQKDEVEEEITDTSQLRLRLWEGCGGAETQETLWLGHLGTARAVGLTSTAVNGHIYFYDVYDGD